MFVIKVFHGLNDTTVPAVTVLTAVWPQPEFPDPILQILLKFGDPVLTNPFKSVDCINPAAE
jgi:hypothetical protein